VVVEVKIRLIRVLLGRMGGDGGGEILGRLWNISSMCSTRGDAGVEWWLTRYGVLFLIMTPNNCFPSCKVFDTLLRYMTHIL